MSPSLAASKLIKAFEGLRLEPYQDIRGYWTIGYGHKLAKNEPHKPITEAEANELLKMDVVMTGSGLSRVTWKIPLTQNQFDALTSLTFNIGLAALASSTLLYKLNLKDYSGAANEFPRWDKVDGREIDWQMKRRAAEKKLFLTA